MRSCIINTEPLLNQSLTGPMSGSVKNKKKEKKERKEEIETSFDYSQGMMRGFPFKDLEKNPKSNIKARRKSLEERD